MKKRLPMLILLWYLWMMCVAMETENVAMGTKTVAMESEDFFTEIQPAKFDFYKSLMTQKNIMKIIFLYVNPLLETQLLKLNSITANIIISMKLQAIKNIRNAKTFATIGGLFKVMSSETKRLLRFFRYYQLPLLISDKLINQFDGTDQQITSELIFHLSPAYFYVFWCQRFEVTEKILFLDDNYCLFFSKRINETTEHLIFLEENFGMNTSLFLSSAQRKIMSELNTGEPWLLIMFVTKGDFFDISFVVEKTRHSFVHNFETFGTFFINHLVSEL